MKSMSFKLGAIALGLAALSLSGSAVASDCTQQRASAPSSPQAARVRAAPLWWDMGLLGPGYFNPVTQMVELENALNGFWMPVMYEPPFAAQEVSAVQRTPGGYRVSLSLPGFKPDDVHVQVNGRQLNISARASSDGPMKVGRQTERVRSEGSFAETLTLPGPVRAKGIEKSFRDGVLTINLPSATSTSSAS